MNKVCVKGQRIYFYRHPEPIPKSQVNFSRIEFDMDETWGSFLSVVAQFIQRGKPKNVQVKDGYCFVPPELEVGAFELCLRGDDGESVVASVNRLTFEVCEGFDPSGETPLPPSPDLYTQLIKEIDSGKKIAQSVREDAEAGKFNGITPTIGDNGNWYLGDTDTGKPSRGETGQAGADGRDGADGQPGADGKSAYQYAVEGGYTGTKEEFAAKLSKEMPDKLPNPNALTFAGAVSGSYDGSAPFEVEIPSGGGGYGEIVTADETILASGTIATGTVKDTYIDTGVTLAELRNWKHWTVEVKSAGQTTYWGVGFNRNRICRVQHSNIKFQIEWIDSAKTIARVFYSAGTGYEYGNDDILNNVLNSALPVAHKQGAYAKVTGTDDSALNINMFNDLTVDALWRVKGVLRYGD